MKNNVDKKIIGFIEESKKQLTVNDLIIGLYKKYGHEVTNRNSLRGLLYRMAKAKIIPYMPSNKSSRVIKEA